MSTEVENLIGKQILKYRKERGLTQSELSELIDVTIETVSRLERGVSIPSLKTIENISNILNIPLKQFFDFNYQLPSTDSAKEQEILKLVAYLKTRSLTDIQMGYRILKGIFDQIDNNYHRK